MLLYVVPCYCRYIDILQILLDTGITTDTLVYTQHTPAATTLVVTVITVVIVDIAYYTTTYTPILL